MTNKELIGTLRTLGLLSQVNDVYYTRFEDGSVSEKFNICETFNKLNKLEIALHNNLELHCVFSTYYGEKYVDLFKRDFDLMYKWISTIKKHCINKNIDLYIRDFLIEFVSNKGNMIRALENLRELHGVSQILIDDTIYDIDECLMGIGNRWMVLTEHNDKIGKVEDLNIVKYLIIKDDKVIKGYTDKIKEEDYEIIIKN